MMVYLCNFYLASVDDSLKDEQETVCKTLSCFGQVENEQILNVEDWMLCLDMLSKSECCIFIIGQNFNNFTEKEFDYAKTHGKCLLVLRTPNTSKNTNIALDQFNNKINFSGAFIEEFSNKTDIELKTIDCIYKAMQSGKINQDWNRFFCGVEQTKNPSAVEKMFDKMVDEQRSNIDAQFKSKIIKYIFELLNGESSLSGKEKYMKWLKKYFGFVQQNNYKDVVGVFKCLVSPEFTEENYPCTGEVAKKITPDMIFGNIECFIDPCCDVCDNKKHNGRKIIYDKVKEIDKTKLSPESKDMLESALVVFEKGVTESAAYDKVLDWREKKLCGSLHR